MPAIIIVAVLIVCAIAAPYFVRWLRRRTEAEHARRLRVAQGIFDESDVKALTKKRRRFFKFHFNKSDKPPLKAQQLQAIKTQLPALTDGLLKAQRLFKDLRSQHQQAAASYAEALSGQSAKAVHVLASSAAQPPQLDGLVTACKETRRAGRQFAVLTRRLSKATSAAEDASRTLSSTLTELYQADTSSLDEDLEVIFELAKKVSGECYSFTVGAPAAAVPDLVGEPETPYEPAETHSEQLLAAVKELAVATAALEKARESAEREFNSFSKVSQPKQHLEPTRPIEEDVQTFLADATNWAHAVQDQMLSLESVLPALDSALAAHTASVNALNAQLSQLDLLQQKAQEEALESARQAERAALEELRRSWRSGSEGGEVIADDGSPAVANPVPANRKKRPMWFISDEAQSRRVASRLVRDNCLQRQQRASNNLSTWRSQCVKIVEGAGSAEDQRLLSELQATLRKFAFATAQANAAMEKLAIAKQTPAALVEAVKPSAHEPGVDGYIQAYERWIKDCASNRQANAERSERIRALEHQSDERQKQLDAAVATLKALFSHSAYFEPTPSVRPAQLDAGMRAARALYKPYADAEAAKRAREAAQLRAQAEAAARKRRDDEEEEARRRRRRRGY